MMRYDSWRVTLGCQAARALECQRDDAALRTAVAARDTEIFAGFGDEPPKPRDDNPEDGEKLSQGPVLASAYDGTPTVFGAGYKAHLATF